MSAHVHTFVMHDVLNRRYRCTECGVYGTRRGTKLVALTCQHETDDRHKCGADVVQVDGNRQHARCAEHVREWKKAA